MAKRIVLAVAGAGKTFNICQCINWEKKNLILAYTNENIHNINHELVSNFGTIPELTNVMTFDSFIYRYVLCPYEPTILQAFGKEEFNRKGITTRKPPQANFLKNGRRIPNRKYQNKDKLGHYEFEGFYYCENIAELIMAVKMGKEKLINKVADTINTFYDQVCIDEFQDFREYDYEVIVALAKKINNITLVGDYYQHSVSGQNNSGKPFKKGKNEVSYDEFLENLKKEKFDVDHISFGSSRRCPEAVCNFVNEKLKINIIADNTHQGDVHWVEAEEVEKILDDNKIMKLVWMEANKYSFSALNWSYSKGDTFENVCVVLTDTFVELDTDTFDISKISQITRNKLYVALTRTKGELYLVKKKVFDGVKEKYKLDLN